ncbi:MAG: single-stranded DNA-binding protein [Candidatus Hydrogenedentes bacterium]|nr:single-stranded DNA-binding protein [Candidatus Hydrogenedentota bacterium]
MSDFRMPDFNKVYVAGRLTHDPELKYLPSGTAFCKLRLAVSRSYKSKDGERKEDTFYINASAWDKGAEYLGEHLKKGRPVLVEGRLTSNEWEDKATGQKRSMIEIRADRVQQLDWDQAGSGGSPAPRPQPRAIEEPVPEDDIPF